jgi:transposase
MSEASCPGCAQRDALIEALQRRVEELERLVKDLQARLGANASNSSIPPSANPPGVPKPVAKAPTGRKPGGQPGHRGHHRQRLPLDRVDHVVAYVPETCTRCQGTLPAEPRPGDLKWTPLSRPKNGDPSLLPLQALMALASR